MASKQRGKGGGKRAPVGQRRRGRAAAALGTTIQGKAQLDAMQARSQERYGLGIGVLVQEEARFRREAASHAGELARLGRSRRLWRWWPFSRAGRLARMERDARERAEEWARRLRHVALDVARQTDDSVISETLDRGAVSGGER